MFTRRESLPPPLPQEPDQEELEVRDIPPGPPERPIRLFGEDAVRALLAFATLLLFLLTIIFAFNNLSADSWPNAKELLQIIIPVETLLLGGAVGFYYGANKK